VCVCVLAGLGGTARVWRGALIALSCVLVSDSWGSIGYRGVNVAARLARWPDMETSGFGGAFGSDGGRVVDPYGLVRACGRKKVLHSLTKQIY
jgi:hypothetical protein